jgi:uracil-DNA glycosylase
MHLDYLAQSYQHIHPAWQSILAEKCGDELNDLDRHLTNAAKEIIIFPPRMQTLRALELSPEKIKVIILGQDPYHGENQANGLAFAVNHGIKAPPSLRNIFKELRIEYPALQNLPTNDLLFWQQQGVLLLNTTLTVIKDQANSMSKIGWQTISDTIISHLTSTNSCCVFMLWGNFARSKHILLTNPSQLILEAAHPSPLSANRGFFGCNHFLLANEYLQNQKKSPITWLT